MPRLPCSSFAVAAFAGALSLCLPGLATAASAHGVSMEVLVDGRPLGEMRTEMRTYVKARKGRSYTIRLTNETGGRVAVALAVDGLNSIDATHTSARDAAKWVLAPYETTEIRGWQVDDRSARRFVFTSEEKSYGAWLGDSRNLGVISAVFFAERSPGVCCFDSPVMPYDGYGRGGHDDGAGAAAELEASSRSRGSVRRDAGRNAEAKPSPDQALGAENSRSPATTVAPTPRRKSEARAATGMGGRTRHEVQWTSFDFDPKPLASFDVRYAYRDELVALGIDPDWTLVSPTIRRRERAVGFAPDPGPACCR